MLANRLQSNKLTSDDRDAIYKELQHIAHQIDGRHPPKGGPKGGSKGHGELHMIKAAITSHVDPHVKTRLFINQLANGPTGSPKEGQGFELLIVMPNRRERLQEAMHQTCDNCWRDVMGNMFLLLADKWVRDMMHRFTQVQQLLDNGHIDKATALKLVTLFKARLRHVDKLVQRASVPGHGPEAKAEYVELVEDLYRQIVALVNDVMTIMFVRH